MTMTDEVTQQEQYSVGSLAAGAYTYPRSSWCEALMGGYTCTLQSSAPHRHHVAAMSTGRIVQIWANDGYVEPAAPDETIEAFQERVRDTARHVVESMGYGSHEVFAEILAKLGITPPRRFGTTVRVKATQVVALGALAGVDEDAVRTKAHEAAIASVSNYSWRIDDTDAAAFEVTLVEITDDDEDLPEPEPGADTNDLDTYKALTRQVAIDAASEHDWCDNGLNQVLDRLGLDRKARYYDVSVDVRASQTVSVRVYAESEDRASEAVTTSDVSNALSSYNWSWESEDWEAGEVQEADDQD